MDHATRIAAGLMMAVVVSVTPFSSGRAQCEGPAISILSAVDVYASPPTFSTGKGWVLGPRLATLPQGSCVRVLERRTIGFGGSSKPWARIQFRAANGAGSGWIPVDGVLAAATSAPALSLLPVALADSGTAADLGVPSDVVVLLWVFAAMVLGMVAKGIVDHTGQRLFTHSYMRETVRALVVSPLVFAGLARAGDFQFHNTTAFVVFLCMAFQNGFFWQTILVKPSPPGAAAPASTAPAAAA